MINVVIRFIVHKSLMQNVVKTKDIYEDDKNKIESIRNTTF